MFVCRLAGDKDAYVPTLNEEHSAWKWILAEELRARDDMHPVVQLALRHHWEEVSGLMNDRVTC